MSAKRQKRYHVAEDRHERLGPAAYEELNPDDQWPDQWPAGPFARVRGRRGLRRFDATPREWRRPACAAVQAASDVPLVIAEVVVDFAGPAPLFVDAGQSSVGTFLFDRATQFHAVESDWDWDDDEDADLRWEEVTLVRTAASVVPGERTSVVFRWPDAMQIVHPSGDEVVRATVGVVPASVSVRDVVVLDLEEPAGRSLLHVFVDGSTVDVLRERRDGGPGAHQQWSEVWDDVFGEEATTSDRGLEITLHVDLSADEGFLSVEVQGKPVPTTWPLGRVEEPMFPAADVKHWRGAGAVERR